MTTMGKLLLFPDMAPPAPAVAVAGLKRCRGCGRTTPTLVSIGSSAERTHCARCQGRANARNDPRPFRPHRGRR